MNQPVERELADLLAKEHSALESLKQILEMESRALANRELDAIKQCAQSKRERLSALSKQVQLRLDFLSTQKIEASEAGFDQLISTFDHSVQQPLKEQWDRLKTGFTDLQIHNDKNGLIIQQSQIRNRTLMGILHGDRNQPNLYNKGGSAPQGANKQPLGEA